MTVIQTVSEKDELLYKQFWHKYASIKTPESLSQRKS